MTETAKPSWPKLPNGTTDWEAVFEDPVSGLIPLIGQARTAAALRQCTALVIEQLHTRKNDPDVVARFISQLDEMVPDGTPEAMLPKISAAISGILRQIKDDRVAKAAAHVSAKAVAPSTAETGGAAADEEPQGTEPDSPDYPDPIDRIEANDDFEERRQDGDEDGDIPIFLLEETKSPPYGLYTGIGAAALAAAALVFYLVAVPSEPTDAETNKLFIRQMEAAAGGKAVEEHVFGGALTVGTLAGRTAVTAAAVPNGACQSIAWSLAARGHVMISGVMPKRVQPAVLKELCTKKLLGATLVWLPRRKK